MSKICILCKHFEFSMGDCGYSEETPSSPARCSCYKGHWELETQNGYASDLRRNMVKAETCQDYKHHADKS